MESKKKKEKRERKKKKIRQCKWKFTNLLSKNQREASRKGITQNPNINELTEFEQSKISIQSQAKTRSISTNNYFHLGSFFPAKNGQVRWFYTGTQADRST